MASRNDFKKLMKLLDEKSNKTNLIYQKELLKHYRSSLMKVKQDIINYFEKFGNENNIAQLRLNTLENQIGRIINDLNKTTLTTIESGIIDTYALNYNGVGQALKTSIGFGIINEGTINASVVNQYNWKGAQTKYGVRLLSGIKQEISQGLITGKSIQDTTKLITKRFNVSANNSLKIVRTEMHRSENAGRLLAFDDNKEVAEGLGYKMVKIWSSAPGSRTRDEHAQMDGVEADDNGLFTLSDGITTEAPGLTGDPYHDVNCRCSYITDLININN